MVLLEAKSFGLPLVSFDIMTGPRDIIEDGVNGYLIQPYDMDKMAEKIIALIDSLALRQLFSVHSQDDMERFSWQNIRAAWDSVLYNISKKSG